MPTGPRRFSRRDLLRTSLIAAAGAGLAAACGTSANVATAATSESATPTGATSAGSTPGGLTSSSGSSTPSSSTGSGFPVTVTHKFGSTTIKSPPERVLSLGYTDHEVLLALGVIPIGVIQWIPEWKKGVSSWSESRLKGTTPALFQYELDFEKAASLRPDLIFNVGFDPDQKTYDTLSAIAPTIPPPAGVKPYGVAWEQMTTIVSSALGRKSEGEQLIATTQALLASTAAAHPMFKAKTVAIGNVYQNQIGYYTKIDIRAQLLHELGFVDNPFVSAASTANFYGTLSAEQADSLNADLLIFFGEPGTTRASLLKAFPALATVPVVKDGRMLLMTDLQDTMAFSAASVLSIPLALQAVVPGAQKLLA